MLLLSFVKIQFRFGIYKYVPVHGALFQVTVSTLIPIQWLVLLKSSKMNNTSLTLAIVYAGIPNNIFISVQTENPKRVPSFRFFLYNPRMASMPLIVVEAVRKLR